MAFRMKTRSRKRGGDFTLRSLHKDLVSFPRRAPPHSGGCFLPLCPPCWNTANTFPVSNTSAVMAYSIFPNILLETTV